MSGLEKNIRAVQANDIPRCDCWCFGFPCQDISIAGKQHGFAGQRSSLFFAVTKLIRELEEKDRPTYLFIENVKNLLSINGGFDFAKLLIELDEIGYNAEWQVLNSANFGVPQNRERVFIVGYLRSRGDSGQEVFPIGGTNIGTLKQVVGGVQGNRVYDITGIAPTLVGNAGGLGAKTGLYAIPVLTPDRLIKRQNGRRFKENGEPMFTLTSQDRHGVMIPEFIPKPSDINRTLRKGGWDTPTAKHNFNTIFDGVRIRKLTPKECFRLQG